MKKFLFYFVLLFIFVACNKENNISNQSEPKPYSIAEYGFEGEVKTAVEKNYTLNIETGEYELVSIYEVNFNKKGFATSEKYCSSDMQSSMESAFIYNDNDDCLQRNDDLNMFGDAYKTSETLEYDKLGHITYRCLIGYDGNAQYTYNIYDGDNLVQTETYVQEPNSEKRLMVRSVYEYSNKGYYDKSISENFNKDGSVDKEIILYKYDDKGNRIQMQFVDEDGNILSTYKSKYNENGREIECSMYNNQSILENRLEYIYNEEDCCVETRTYFNEVLTSITLFKYDEYKHILECVRINYEMATKEVDTYEYEYDKYGNIIKMIVYDNDMNVVSKDEREFIYY